MREVIYKNVFKKQLKLMQARGKDMDKIKKAINILANDLPIPASYKDHALTNNFAGFRDLHIESDWLLIYYKKEANADQPNGSLYLELTGTHSDLF
jgi:mRNA interferase YafQ